MSLKTKIICIIAAHPKLVTFGIGLAITSVIGIAIGMLDHQQVFVLVSCRYCWLISMNK